MSMRVAASTSWADVNFAVNGGGPDSNGVTFTGSAMLAVGVDGVTVPAGNASGADAWTTTLTIDGTGMAAGKTFKLQGAGIGSTVITQSVTTQVLLKVKKFSNNYYEVTGFSFVAPGNTSEAIVSLGFTATKDLVNGAGTSFRIHHNEWRDGTWHTGLKVLGIAYGLVDHNTFIKTSENAAQAITILGSGQYPTIPGDTAASFPAGDTWATAATFGASDMLFIEDNVINFRSANDAACEGYMGSRYVLRHNTIYNTSNGNHGLDSGVCSTHSFETYLNDFYFNNSTVYNPNNSVEARGGTGLWWGNRNLDTISLFTDFHTRIDVDRGVGFAISGHGAHCGFVTGVNPYDGNISKTTASGLPLGWPGIECVGTTGPITLHTIPTPATVPSLPLMMFNNTHGTGTGDQVLGTSTNTTSGVNQQRFSGTNLVIVSRTGTTAGSFVVVSSATHNFTQTATGASTTVAAASDGAVLPQSNITLVSGTGFGTANAGGYAMIQADMGGTLGVQEQFVQYDSVVSNVLKNCTGYGPISGFGTLATGNTAKFLTAANLTAGDIASWIHVTGGTGFNAGWYQIIACSGNNAILVTNSTYPNVGTVGSTGGVWSENWFAVGPTDIVAQNRDWYQDLGAVQTSSTSPFNGTVGVGIGTLARRPTTCTAGVGYWATDVSKSGSDAGTLYRATATNTWSTIGDGVTYQPYTYPHPLSGGVVAGATIALSGALSFGSVIVGQTAQLTEVVSNTSGNGTTLNVSSVSYPTGFSGSTSGFTVADGATHNITVTFTPVSAISYSGNMTVNSDAINNSAITAALSGTGSAPATTSSSFSPTALIE